MMIQSTIEVKSEPIDLPTVPILPRTSSSSGQDRSRFYHFSTSQPEVSICAWCQKYDVRSFSFRTDTGDSRSLCSEICFNQYRRASFKKNKVNEEEPGVLRSYQRDFDEQKKSSITERKSKTPVNSIESPRRKFLLPVRRVSPPPSSSKRLCLDSSTEKLLSNPSSSTITCLLPTFVPLPIPIPIPLHLPCSKCSSIQVTNVECQTD